MRQMTPLDDGREVVCVGGPFDGMNIRVGPGVVTFQVGDQEAPRDDPRPITSHVYRRRALSEAVEIFEWIEAG